MKKNILPLLLLSSIASVSLEAKTDGFLFGSENNLHITVNNRILAKVNGKAISVVDVMKKMDVLFYRQFPEYATSVPARYQFYQVNWKYVLRELIDKELILADASEVKVPLSNGDIRQEMELLFGPNIIGNLDKIGMSYDDAWNIVKGDIWFRRMVQYKVNAKAVREVTPQVIRSAYADFAKENTVPESFVYQVVSVRSSDSEKGKSAANIIEQQLKTKTLSIEALKEGLNGKSPYGDGVNVSISEEFTHNEKEMSAAYKETILKMNENSFSSAIAQKSRADNSTVFRIFYLNKKNAGGAPPFSEAEAAIKEKLFEKSIDKEMTAYLKKLREHFDVQENHLLDLKDSDFQPFSMK